MYDVIDLLLLCLAVELRDVLKNEEKVIQQLVALGVDPEVAYQLVRSSLSFIEVRISCLLALDPEI